MMEIGNLERDWPRIGAVVLRMLGIDAVQRMQRALRNETALILRSHDASCVVTLSGTPEDPELLIWAAAGSGTGLVERYLPELIGVAREIGAHRITFQPGRVGWARRLRGTGHPWKLREDGMFSLEVD